ncbi:MAG TPA: hypothetical protein VHC86_14555 [Opitutaceae bacterium]|nr:hypothetical protein [Opitutaceae bacterium]
MPSVSASPRCHDFGFPLLDTRVRVEDFPGGVLVRASRNSFSERQKEQFVAWLAAEGFIPGEYRWLPVGRARGVRWVIDVSWMPQAPGPLRRAWRRLRWLFCRRQGRLGA